jgi:hypothetical protein
MPIVGRYRIVFDDGSSVEQSFDAAVSILPTTKRLELTKPLEDVTCVEGERLCLTAELSRAVQPDDLIEWRLNDRFLLSSLQNERVDRFDADVLRSEAHFRLECSHSDSAEPHRCSLQIERCDAQRHAGVYELLVTPLDEPSHAPVDTRCRVDVVSVSPVNTPTSRAAPRVDIVRRLPDSVRVRAGETLRLECTLSRPLAEQVKWSHRNRQLSTDEPNGTHVEQNDDGCRHWLVIHNVQPDTHDGTYQLDAEGALSKLFLPHFCSLSAADCLYDARSDV